MPFTKSISTGIIFPEYVLPGKIVEPSFALPIAIVLDDFTAFLETRPLLD